MLNLIYLFAITGGGHRDHRWQRLQGDVAMLASSRCVCEVGEVPEDVKSKIMSMEPKDIPLQQRRCLYNQMGRRLRHDDMPKGLLEQYAGCLGNDKKRFSMLRHFICDKQMRLRLQLDRTIYVHT